MFCFVDLRNIGLFFMCSSLQFVMVLDWTGTEVIQRKSTRISLTLNAIFMSMMLSCKIKTLRKSWSIHMWKI